MNKTVYGHLLKKLCPNEVWTLSYIMKLVLKYHISRMPKREVTEYETRYPVNPASMRAFLAKFYTRHYLQVQNSLINYMSSNDFTNNKNWKAKNS